MKIIVDKIPAIANRCSFARPNHNRGVYDCLLKDKKNPSHRICDKECNKPCEELITFIDAMHDYYS